MTDADELGAEDVEALVAAVRSLDRRVAILETHLDRLEADAGRQHSAESDKDAKGSDFHSGVDLRCPTCGDDGDIATVQIAAMTLEEDGRMTPNLLEALSGETHACVRCAEPFTP